jgi:hypothetical protein
MTTRISKAAAIAVFGAAGWKDAGTWPLEKMAAKLKDVPECMDDDYEADGDDADTIKKTLTDIDNAATAAGDGDPEFEVFEEEAPAAEETAAEEPAAEEPGDDGKADAKAKKAAAKVEKAAERKKKKEASAAAKADKASSKAPTWQSACAQAIRESGHSLEEVQIKDLSARVVELRKSGNEKTALWALRTLITAVNAWESSAA